MRLAKLATFKPVPLLVGAGECGAVDAVLLESVILTDQTKVSVTPAATLRCTMAEQVAIWLREDVAPLVQKRGAPLRGLDNFDSYECRGRNRVRGATLSEHGRANALDVRGFKLANGEVIGLTDVDVSKAWRESVRASACARFSTVLGPGSDGNHEEHIHVDLAERRGGYKTCEWQVREPVKQAETAAPPPAEPQTAEPAVALSEPIPLPRPRPNGGERNPANVQKSAGAARTAALILNFWSDAAIPGEDRRRNYLPIITSEALMTAHASSPFCRARSATASLVIDAMMTMPWPTSMRT